MECNDENIIQLEKYLFEPNKADFLQKLISGTDQYYYFKLLHSIEKFGADLPRDQKVLLKKYKKIKSIQSKSIKIRLCIKNYDEAKTDEQRKKVLQKLNKRLLKITFEHTEAPFGGDDGGLLGGQNDILSSDSEGEQKEEEEYVEEENVCYDEEPAQIFRDEGSDERLSVDSTGERQVRQVKPQRMVHDPRFDPESPRSPQQQQQYQQFQQQQIFDMPIQQQQQLPVKAHDSDSDEKFNLTIAKREVKSSLDQKIIDVNIHLKRAHVYLHNFQKLKPEALSKVDLKKFVDEVRDAEIIKHYLQHADLMGLSDEQLSDILKVYHKLNVAKYKINWKFDFFQLFSRLSLSQLSGLKAFKEIAFSKIPEFVIELFKKTFNVDEGLQTIEERFQEPSVVKEKIERLKQMYQWCQTQLSKDFVFLSDQILSEILNFGLRQNIYDFDYFILYLKNPSEYNANQKTQWQQEYNTKQKKYSSNVRDVSFLKQNNISPLNYQNLVETYVTQYYKINDSTKLAPFDEFFNDKYLHRLLIKARLQRGDQDLSDVSQYFSVQEISNMHKEKVLQICKYNKKFFLRNEEVSIFLEMQNIAQMTVKVFEFVAENYYLTNKKHLDEHIDLDGLTASEEKSFDFSADLVNPCKRIEREFKLDSLQKSKQGVFVVEFFASGIASRVVVHKGKLFATKRNTVAGAAFRILDESGELQIPQKDKRVGIWHRGVYYTADKDGEVIISATERTNSEEVVLVSGGFAGFQSIILEDERYDFFCAFFHNDQSFISGNTAKLLVQPHLILNNEVAQVSFIEEPKVVVTTMTSEQIPATHKFEKEKFDYAKDYEVQFYIPNKIVSITIEVSGKIKTSASAFTSTEGYQQLKYQKIIRFDSHENTTKIASLFLQRDGLGNHILKTLGKNGEPKKSVEVDVVFGHRYLRDITASFVADAEGSINLGQLKDIIGFNATLKSKPSHDIVQVDKSFILDQVHSGLALEQTYDRLLCEGETLKIASLDQYELTRDNFQFIQLSDGKTRGHTILHDKFDSLKFVEGKLVSEGLAPGYYQLWVKPIFKQVYITCLRSAARWGETQSIQTKYSFTDISENQRKTNEPFSIKSITYPEKDTIKIQLNIEDKKAAKYIKVHALTVQFYQNDNCQLDSIQVRSKLNKSQTQVMLLEKQNIFMSNRQLGDEFAYVLNRKGETRFTGNNLDKPQILLMRQYLRDTEEQRAELRRDNSYMRNDFAPNYDDDMGLDASYARDYEESEEPVYSRAAKGIAYKRNAYASGYEGGATSATYHQPIESIHSLYTRFVKSQNVDKMHFFLKTPSQLLSNFVPDENGEILIKLPQTEGLSGIQLQFSTPYHSSVIFVPTPESQQQTQNDTPNTTTTVSIKDQSHKPNLKKDKFYSIFRNVAVLLKGEEFLVTDPASTTTSFVESLSKFFEQQISISKANSQHGRATSYEETWKFLHTWDSLTQEEKLKKFNKHVSHELNFFIYMKDTEFFTKIVKPHLENKIERSLVDFFLLGRFEELLKYYNSAEALSQLNDFEICLMIYALKKSGKDAEAQGYANLLENYEKLKKFDIQNWKRLFDVVLNQTNKASVQNAVPVPVQTANYNQNWNVSQAPQQQPIYMQQQIQYIPQSIQQYSNAPTRLQQAPYSSYAQEAPQQTRDIDGQRYVDRQRRYSCSDDGDSSSEEYISNIGDAEESGGEGGERDYDDDDDEDEAPCSPMQEACEEVCEMKKEVRKEAPSKKKAKIGKPKASKAAYKETDLFDEKYTRLKKLNQQGGKNLEKTKEYQETQYYDGQVSSSTIVQPSLFWLDLAKHITLTGDLKGFFSKNFVYAFSSITEAVLVLAVTDLPFSTPVIKYVNSENTNQQRITSSESIFVFSKEIKEASKHFREDVIITQRFFDPLNRYQYDENDPSIFYEKDVEEFLSHKVYGCQLIITNSNITQQQLQILYEIPEGSIPVSLLEYTKSQMREVAAYSTIMIEFQFYFPKAGKFTIYPANISKDGQVYAVAKSRDFDVLDERVIKQLDSIKEILLSKGSKDDILTFVETKNILNHKIFNFRDIYHLLGDKEFYLRLVEILKKRKIYDHTVFSYSVFHADHETIRDLLNSAQMKQKIEKYIRYIDSTLIKVPQSITIDRASAVKLLEYYPLVNPRVHLLRRDAANIENKQLKEQYHNLLVYLVEKGNKVEPQDHLALVYYLLLQERVQDAMKVFQKIPESSSSSSSSKIQYDYIAAYLDFYHGYPNFKRAREIIEQYLDYPIVGWRNLFFEMANQLAEYDGEELQEEQGVDTEGQKSGETVTKTIELEQILQLSIEHKDIQIEHKNIDKETATVSFYIIDLEVFYSKRPFLSQLDDDFSYLLPAHKQSVSLTDNKLQTLTNTKIKIDESLENKNVYVQVNSKKKRAGALYFSTNLKIILFENQGILKVTDENGKLLSKVYVKVFAKDKSAKVLFHKDGYTDLRGKFDYLSLQNEGNQNYDKFSLFIMSDELGSLIKEVKAPKVQVKVQETVQLRSHNWQQKQICSRKK